MRNVLKRSWVLVLLLLMIVFVGSGFAGEKEKRHSIDVWLEKCIESNSTTIGMTNCTQDAAVMWDKEMNRIYKELTRELPDKQKILLKQSQTQWLKLRDVEFNFIGEFYGSFDGTIWQNISAGERLNLVKKRTQNLQIYLNYLKEK